MSTLINWCKGMARRARDAVTTASKWNAERFAVAVRWHNEKMRTNPTYRSAVVGAGNVAAKLFGKYALLVAALVVVYEACVTPTPGPTGA